MKHARLLLYCLLLPTLLPILHAGAQDSDGGAMRADVVARVTEFYVFYCHGLTTDTSPLEHPGKLTPYVSSRFIKEINRLSKIEGGIEVDPFVCAQDNDPAWEKNIKISNVKASSDGKTASADVTLGSQKMMTRHLKVSLVNEAGVYKVDRVKDADQ